MLQTGLVCNGAISLDIQLEYLWINICKDGVNMKEYQKEFLYNFLGKAAM